MAERVGSGVGRAGALWAVALSLFVVVGLIWGVVVMAGAAGGGGGSGGRAGAGEGLSAGERRAVVEGVLERAGALLDRGESAAARGLLEETVKRVPNEAGLWMLLAEARFSEGDAGGAYEAMDRGVTLSVEDTAAYRFAAGLYADEAGLGEEARLHWRVASELAPSEAKYPLYLAMVEQRDGNIGEARVQAVRAAHLEPGTHEAWGILAQIAFDENRLGVAREHLAKARRIAPGAVNYRVLEARILRRENRPERAASVLMGIDDEVLYGNPAIVEDLARCYLMLGERARAAGVYAAGARANGSDGASALAAARLYRELGDEEAARGFAQAAALRGESEGRRLLEAMAAVGGGSEAGAGG